jgi:hypothetical protein
LPSNYYVQLSSLNQKFFTSIPHSCFWAQLLLTLSALFACVMVMASSLDPLTAALTNAVQKAVHDEVTPLRDELQRLKLQNIDQGNKLTEYESQLQFFTEARGQKDATLAAEIEGIGGQVFQLDLVLNGQVNDLTEAATLVKGLQEDAKAQNTHVSKLASLESQFDALMADLMDVEAQLSAVPGLVLEVLKKRDEQIDSLRDQMIALQNLLPSSGIFGHTQLLSDRPTTDATDFPSEGADVQRLSTAVGQLLEKSEVTPSAHGGAHDKSMTSIKTRQASGTQATAGASNVDPQDKIKVCPYGSALNHNLICVAAKSSPQDTSSTNARVHGTARCSVVSRA